VIVSVEIGAVIVVYKDTTAEVSRMVVVHWSVDSVSASMGMDRILTCITLEQNILT